MAQAGLGAAEAPTAPLPSTVKLTAVWLYCWPLSVSVSSTHPVERSSGVTQRTDVPEDAVLGTSIAGTVRGREGSMGASKRHR